MQEFIQTSWQAVLSANGLREFEDFWAVEHAWFEVPNHRRGGWSGVMCFTLKQADGSELEVFLKRQENQMTTTIWHPIKGMLTFAKEFYYLKLFKKLGIPSLNPIYFAQKQSKHSHRAILMTEALQGFLSLEVYLEQWHQSGWPTSKQQQLIMQAVAQPIRLMHQHHLQHNCLYPKHIFIYFHKPVAQLTRMTQISVSLIDLERCKWQALRLIIQLRDLYTFYCHADKIKFKQALRFFKIYFQIDKLTPYHKWLWRKIVHKVRRKKRSY